MVSTAECELNLLDDLSLLDDVALVDALRDGERSRRRLEARQALIVRELDRRKVWKADGHASIRGLVNVVTNRAPWEVTALAQTGRLLDARPETASAMVDGDLGVAQAQQLAKTYAHPRCGDSYGDVADTLLTVATTLPFRDFKTVVDRFEAIADEDGANQRAEANHANRDAFFHVGANGLHGEIRGGVLAGEVAKEILDRFAQVEFEKDWAWTQEHFGADANPTLMPRTAPQRRFDAFMAILERSISTPAGGQGPEPVANIHADPTTFARVVAKVMGIEPEPIDGAMLLNERRCETSNGNPVALVEVAAVVLAGHVRRVVLDSASVVIDLGRKQRLFTGNARIAAHMGHPRCIWPGCEIPAARSQTDHLTPWNDNGTTSPRDGAPCCERHNLFKHNHGYTITRDHHGHFHTYRPDGTEVC
jgi:hypothetical protein